MSWKPENTSPRKDWSGLSGMVPLLGRGYAVALEPRHNSILDLYTDVIATIVVLISPPSLYATTSTTLRSNSRIHSEMPTATPSNLITRSWWSQFSPLLCLRLLTGKIFTWSWATTMPRSRLPLRKRWRLWRRGWPFWRASRAARRPSGNVDPEEWSRTTYSEVYSNLALVTTYTQFVQWPFVYIYSSAYIIYMLTSYKLHSIPL